MFVRLTALLCAGLYGSMLIFGTDPGGTEGTEIASRADFAPAALPPLPAAADASEATGVTPVSYTAPETAAATELQPVKAKPAVAEDSRAPEIAPQIGEVKKNSGLMQVSTLDAPAERLADMGLDVVEVTGNVVNLRSGPSTANEVVARLTRGVRAELISDTGDGWMQIRDLNSGAEGYMSAKFLTPVTSG